jgi:hypothetical protein
MQLLYTEYSYKLFRCEVRYMKIKAFRVFDLRENIYSSPVILRGNSPQKVAKDVLNKSEVEEDRVNTKIVVHDLKDNRKYWFR